MKSHDKKHEFEPFWFDPSLCDIQECRLPASADIHMPDTAKVAQEATEAQESRRDHLTAKYLKGLQDCIDSRDTEEGHVGADQLLCDLLTELGYQEVVDLYTMIDKWYA